jgi:PAS domain S-box-containing protein
MKKNNFRDNIYKFLLSAEKGATASDIAKSISSNRMTITKYLDIMKGQDLVNYKGVGMAKLWYINSSPLLNSFGEGENLPIKEAMNLLGEGICVLDRDMRLVWYNDVIESIAGKLEKNKGKSCYELLDMKPLEKKQECVIKTFNTGETCKSVQKLTLKDGRKLYFDVVTTPIKDKNGKVIAVMVLTIDLNDYERKMNELRALMGK